MDGPGTYSQPPYAGGSKDESGTAAKDTISIGSGDRVSGAERMGMEVHGIEEVRNLCQKAGLVLESGEKRGFFRLHCLIRKPG